VWPHYHYLGLTNLASLFYLVEAQMANSLIL
jgi:hypothetical protein